MFMVATSVALWLESGFAINIKGIFVALCYFYFVCGCPYKVLYPEGCCVLLAILRRMFLFYVSHSVHQMQLKMGWL